MKKYNDSQWDPIWLWTQLTLMIWTKTVQNNLQNIKFHRRKKPYMFFDMRVNNSIFIFGWRAIHQSSNTAKHVCHLIWTRWLDVNRDITSHCTASPASPFMWSAYSVFAASSSCVNHRDWDIYCPSWSNTHFSNARNVSSIILLNPAFIWHIKQSDVLIY